MSLTKVNPRGQITIPAKFRDILNCKSGDYGDPKKKIVYGSRSSHTIMSHFDIDLNIITLLEGERKVNKPIHNSRHYKELKKTRLKRLLYYSNK